MERQVLKGQLLDERCFKAEIIIADRPKEEDWDLPPKVMLTENR